MADVKTAEVPKTTSTAETPTPTKIPDADDPEKRLGELKSAAERVIAPPVTAESVLKDHNQNLTARDAAVPPIANTEPAVIRVPGKGNTAINPLEAQPQVAKKSLLGKIGSVVTSPIRLITSLFRKG